MTMQNIYEEIYEDFVKRLTEGEIIEPAETGKVIVQLAHQYGHVAKLLPDLERKVNVLLATTIQGTDKETGKPMSASKADILVKASDEFHILNLAKSQLEMLESYINALKAMAKAQTGEMQSLGR